MITNIKSECRISNIETSSNFEFRISKLSRISDFGFRILLGVIIVTLCFTSTVSEIVRAQSTSSTFTESLTTNGVSGQPPSIPTGLKATAVSNSQIDLKWDASTSGGIYPIVGYLIFRDSSFLATTTALSYSDLGLMAQTTYSYTVESFDSDNVLSGQSAPVSATTLANTPPNNGGGGGGQGSIELHILDIKIVPDLNTATVSFKTNAPAQAKIFWGQTTDVEMGSLSELVYGKDHELQITGLHSGKTYFVRIEAINNQGVSISTVTQFTTVSPVPVYPLANPSSFQAQPKEDHIALSWNNPSDTRFDSVRIVRSETFFPRDQFDGVPVYEGKGQLFNDSDVTAGKTYYYAIFAKGIDGQFSSGALAQARITKEGEIVISPTSTDPFANIPESQNVDPMIRALTLSDFDFIQEGKILVQINDTIVAVNGGENLVISLKYEKVPEVLKTIAITLTDPKDPTKVFPFLLRVNADKSAYQATLAPLGRSGSYAMSIVVLDYQNQGLVRIHGSLEALAFAAVPAFTRAVQAGVDPLGFLFLLALILLILLVLAILRRHHREESEWNVIVPGRASINNHHLDHRHPGSPG